MLVPETLQTQCSHQWMVSSAFLFKSNLFMDGDTDEVEERIMQINATGVIKGTKVALLHMAKRGGGSIVHLASAAGFFSGA